MKVISHEPVTLLKVTKSDFAGRDGKNVAYTTARILDDQGNVFELAVQSDIVPALQLLNPNPKGIATIDLYTGKDKAGKQINKLRLSAFVEEE